MEGYYKDDDYSDSQEKDFDKSAKQRLADLVLDSPEFSSNQQSQEKGEEILAILSDALLGKDIYHVVSPALPSLRLRYSTIDLVTLGIVPTGYYAWGLWGSDDTLSVCVAGTPSDSTFYDLACSRFYAHRDRIIVVGLDPAEISFELLISSVKVKLLYHRNTYISRWSDISKDNFSDFKANLPWRATGHYDGLIETHEMAERLSQHDGDDVTRSYRCYWTWAKHLGLSPDLLSKDHILCLAVWGLNAEIRPSELLNLDLPIPSSNDHVRKVANSLGLQKTSFEEWRLQIIADVTGKSSDGIGSFLRESGLICDYKISQWPMFFTIWPYYLRFNVSFWGSSSMSADKWFAKIEKEIKKHISHEAYLNNTYQLWPYPFEEHKDCPWIDDNKKLGSLAEQTTDNIPQIVAKVVEDAPYLESEEGQKHFELSYFVGCRSQPTSIFRNKNYHVNGGMTLYFNGISDGSCSLEYLNRNQIQPIWYPYILKRTFKPVSPAELGIDEDDESNEEEGHSSVASSKPKTSKSKSKQQRKRDKAVSIPSEEQDSVYLRPAADVLHRLRHDSRFKAGDFLIGCLDRFKGIKEVPLEAWTTEKTSQEFIPLSRIRYFKRKSDGEVVWDRMAKIDLIFNTGVKH